MPEIDKDTINWLATEVEKTIEHVSTKYDDIPTETILLASQRMKKYPGADINSKQVPNPASRVYNSDVPGDFHEVAEQIVDSNPLPPRHRIDHTGEEVEITELKTDRSRRVKTLAFRLQNVAGLTMNYTGDYSFSSKAFRDAYEDLMGEFFEEKIEFTIIAPVLNAGFEQDQYELESPDSFWLRDDKIGDTKYKVEMGSSMELSKISDEERSAIFTDEEGLMEEFRRIGYVIPGPLDGSSDKNPFSGSSALASTHKIKFQFRSHIGPPDDLRVVGKICDWILGGLRIICPHEQLEIENTYDVYNLEASYADDIPTIGYAGGKGRRRGRLPYNRRFEYVSFSENADYWPLLWEHLPAINHEDPENVFYRPFVRFDSMYDEKRNEDAVIDCYIALEQTLLKDWRGSYSFVLPTRAVILIEDEVTSTSEYIYEFFNLLQSVRNEIIHGDMRIEEIIQEDPERYKPIKLQNLSSEDFAKRARIFLAAILRRYMGISQETPYNITQINTHIVNESIKSQLKGMKNPPSKE